MGFTLGGWIDTAKDRTDVSGTFVPLYGLNNVVSQVPIFGPLLGGGHNEGLFGINFRVAGAMSSPNISVNPLSAIAPGFLRKLFGAGGGDPNAPIPAHGTLTRTADRGAPAKASSARHFGVDSAGASPYDDDHRGRSSVVERQLPKLNVVGSIPIARSNPHKHLAGAVVSQKPSVPPSDQSRALRRADSRRSSPRQRRKPVVTRAGFNSRPFTMLVAGVVRNGPAGGQRRREVRFLRSCAVYEGLGVTRALSL